MCDPELLVRITCHPKVMASKPVIKGTRLTVENIPNLLTHGSSAAEIVGRELSMVPHTSAVSDIPIYRHEACNESDRTQIIWRPGIV